MSQSRVGVGADVTGSNRPVLTILGSPTPCLEISRRLSVLLEVCADAPIRIRVAAVSANTGDLAELEFLAVSAPHLQWEQCSIDSFSDSKSLWQDTSLVCICADRSDEFFEALEVCSTIPESHGLSTIALVFRHWLCGKACKALASNENSKRIFLIDLTTDDELSAAQISPEVELAAQLIHAHYLSNNVQSGPAAMPWQQLPERYRQSSRLQAESMQFKLLCLGFALNDAPQDSTVLTGIIESRIELLAEAEHQRWMTEKKLQGWTYGVPRNDRLKHHPCLMAYAELPESERQKDREMWRLLPSLI